MEDQIKAHQRRVKGYENIDGTVEMISGLWLMSMSLSPVSWGWIPVVFLGMWGQRMIKRRITYARTGYLLRRKPNRIFLVTAASAVVAAEVIFIILVARHLPVSLVRLGKAALGVAAYGFLAMYSPDHKWKLLVVLFMALCSVPICLAGWSLSLFFGLSWFLSGFATLYLYLQRTRPATWESE